MSSHDLPESDRDLIRRAGTLLDTVGRHGPDGSAAAIDCLTAADDLAALGLNLQPTAMPVSTGDEPVAIREALQLLAKVSGSTFALPEVAAAIDAAQRAYRASTRP